MTLNNDAQLQALKDFASSEDKQLVDQLEEILNDVAKTGQYMFPWQFMKPLYVYKLDKVTSDFLNTNPPLHVDGTPNSEEIQKLKDFRAELLQSFDKFTCAPFTLQRVTELLTNPNRHYRKTTKFFRGLEKNIMVVTTMDMVSPEERASLKRHYDDLKTHNLSASFDRDLRPPLVKRVANIVYSDYTIHGSVSYTTDPQDEKEDVDVLTTTDSISDDVGLTQISMNTVEDYCTTITNGATTYETNGDTNKTSNEYSNDVSEESLQSHEAMD